jgi:hypothetical protein
MSETLELQLIRSYLSEESIPWKGILSIVNIKKREKVCDLFEDAIQAHIGENLMRYLKEERWLTESGGGETILYDLDYDNFLFLLETERGRSHLKWIETVLSDPNTYDVSLDITMDPYNGFNFKTNFNGESINVLCRGELWGEEFEDEDHWDAEEDYSDLLNGEFEEDGDLESEEYQEEPWRMTFHGPDDSPSDGVVKMLENIISSYPDGELSISEKILGFKKMRKMVRRPNFAHREGLVEVLTSRIEEALRDTIAEDVSGNPSIEVIGGRNDSQIQSAPSIELRWNSNSSDEE